MKNKNMPSMLDNDDFDPYEGFKPYEHGSWGDTQWHCIRCGHKLIQIDKDNKDWGDFTWGYMLDHGTQWFLCDNTNCVHARMPLVLHSPIRGWDHPAGDNYSISYVK